MSQSIELSAVEGAACLQLYALDRSGTESVVEGKAYKYRVGGLDGSVTFEPGELFEPDPDDPHTGRFTPRDHVGQIRVEVRSAQVGDPSIFLVEVAAAKLDFEQHYRSMMEQIADRAAEALLLGFAPAQQTMQVDPATVGELNYRALAFLVARLKDEGFQAALEQLRRAPHRQWVKETEQRSLGRGLPTGSAAARQLARPGRGVPTPPHLGHLPVSTVPTSVEWQRNVETLDTPPNRFVRHAIEKWQRLALDVRSALQGSKPEAGPTRRGRREAEWLAERCELLLSDPVLSEAGRLTVFPHGNPVLLRQAGYRDVLRVYALAEASIALDAVLPDDAFAATQRNVAALYEYWCFISLVGCIERVTGQKVSGVLFEPRANGLSLVLRSGRASVLSWDTAVQGRRLQIDLWFNRDFRRTPDRAVEVSTWATTMRPDVSMRIRPKSARPGEAADPHLDTWVHFDAKYRLEVDEKLFDDDEPESVAKRSDVLKMHSYRDAIRRTAGAYVLYPGLGSAQRHREYHEVLPGVGAFPLRPGPDGTATGSEILEEFIGDVLHQAANQASAAERSQFWLTKHTQESGRRIRSTESLELPPADHPVLIGYVRPDQLPWVRATRRYNLRADRRRGAVSLTDDVLAATILVLWTPDDAGDPMVLGCFKRTGPWQVVTVAEMLEAGYPGRDGAAVYLVAQIDAAEATLDLSLDRRAALAATDPRGAPTITTWASVSRSG
jgi:hypothetical protein